MTRRIEIATIVALVALAVVVRIPGLNSGLWYDEIVTLVESARPTLGQIVSAFPDSNNHPLYSLLAHLSMSAFGEHVWTVRLPAVAFGVASVPALYYLGAAVTSRLEALLAAMLLAVSYQGVWFSQNARGYSALLFFAIVSTTLFLRMRHRRERSLRFAYAVAVGLGLYTHLTMLFVAAAHGAIWAGQAWTAVEVSDRRRQIRTAVAALGGAALIGAALYAPVAPQVYKFFAGARHAAASVATPKWAVVEALRGLQIGFGVLGVAMAFGFVLLGTLSYRRDDPLVPWVFLLPGAVTAVALLAMRAPIRPRFFFAFFGFALLLLVRGAVRVGRMAPRVVAAHKGAGDAIGTTVVVLIAVVSVWSLRFNYRFPKQDFDGAKTFIGTHRHAPEPVGTGGLATYPYSRYFQLPWTPIENVEQLARLRKDSSRAWVVYSFPEYMDPALVKELEHACATARVFQGTVGGGDVVVCTTEAQSR
jgi:hypothetical protein